jgi:hypothetical protein
MAIAQDEMGEDCEHRFACRALYPTDGHPTQMDTDIMRMPRPASAAVTSRLVFQLEAEGEEESDDTLEKRFPVCNQAKVRRFVSKINGDSAVCPRRFGRCAHVSLPGYQVPEGDETQWEQHIETSRHSPMGQDITTKSDGM